MTEEKSITLKSFLEDTVAMNKMSEVLGRNAQSFVTTILQIVAMNDLLKKATFASVYGAALTAATMKLPINPNLGFAYIVPYNNRKTKKQEAQFQMGWKGFVQLAQRTGEFKSVNTAEIYENQFESVDLLTGEIKLKNEAPVGKIVGYISHFSLTNGFQKSLYVTKEEMEKHAKKYSQSYKKGFGVWADGEDGFNAMAKKTVLKHLLAKYAPLSIEMQTAIQADQAVVGENDSEFEYPDNDHEIPSPEEKKKELRDKKKDGDLLMPEMP